MTKKEKKESGIKEKRPHLKGFYRIVAWCSGARLYLLDRCPTDYNRFLGIGAIVIMTGLMAALSGGYALYTIFDSYWAAILFGALWGAMIFFLDWYIVSSLKKEAKFYREFITALPRIILAVLIGVVISKPLELKLFEKEINQEIARMQRENSINYLSLLEDEYREIDDLKKENEQYRLEIENKTEQRNRLFEMIVAEAEGRSPTQRVGKGPVYREKKEEYDRVQQELERLREMNLSRIERNNNRIVTLQKAKDELLSEGDEIHSAAGGFLGRLNAISRLSERDKSVKAANIFIILLFVFVESAPMIVKLMSRRGAYDALLEAEEIASGLASRERKETTIQNFAVRLNEMRDMQEYRVELKTSAEKNKLERLFKARFQLDEEQIEIWKKKRMDYIKSKEDGFLKELDNIVGKDFEIYS